MWSADSLGVETINNNTVARVERQYAITEGRRESTVITPEGEWLATINETRIDIRRQAVWAVVRVDHAASEYSRNGFATIRITGETR